MRFKTVLLFAAAAGCGDNTAGPPEKPDAAIPVVDAPKSIDAPSSNVVAALPLTTPDGTYYNAPLTIGGTAFLLDVDTGSTTTAVAGAGCATCSASHVSPLYTPGASAMDLMHPVSTFYADGSGWKGEVFTDTVGFGGGTPDVKLAFGSITKHMQFFDTSNAEQGILGLGPSELLEQYTTSIVDQLIAANEVPTFAFEMCPTHGTMWVGGYDATKATGDVQYAPMLPIDNNNAWYAVDLRDVKMGGTSLGFGSAQLGYPIVDTGTTLTYLPLAVENALLAKANAAANYATVLAAPLAQNAGQMHDGCVAAQTGVTAAMVDAALPPLAMTFPTGSGTDTFTIEVPATQSYLYDGGDGTFCLAFFDDGGQGALLGDATMRGLVTVIDVAGKRVGLAPDAGCALADAKRAPGVRRMPEHNPHRPHRGHAL